VIGIRWHLAYTMKGDHIACSYEGKEALEANPV
jgi:hypothetical protein